MFKEGDIVVYLEYFKCIVMRALFSEAGNSYLLKQIGTNKLWIAHEEDVKEYKGDEWNAF